jgi:hypothetical protein
MQVQLYMYICRSNYKRYHYCNGLRADWRLAARAPRVALQGDVVRARSAVRAASAPRQPSPWSGSGSGAESNGEDDGEELSTADGRAALLADRLADVTAAVGSAGA